MHSQFADNRPSEIEPAHLKTPSSFVNIDSLMTQAPYSTSEFTEFQGHFQGCMDLYAETDRVTAYLDTHQNWFGRCAHPMKAEPLGANGYALVIGRFGSFGYEVEPKIGLELLPQQDGIYRIQTIPVPDYIPPGYEVDFQASQWLVSLPTSEYILEQESENFQLPPTITRLEWELKLKVGVRFPKFIQKLPQSLILTTGDRLLRQIVRQVSRRLSYKVQQDFHNSLGIPLAKPLRRC
ncbi:MAG TPA: hypothetical protein DC064_17820 [Cyanobacteria bacterium UBA9273]|nr:hypothetical protein [Cyanobacteria bacterium UBA9273]